MKTILVKNKYFPTINEMPPNITDEKWKRMDEDAVLDLYFGLANDIFLRLQEKKSKWNMRLSYKTIQD